MAAISDEVLAQFGRQLTEQIRLLETRLARSAIPEDGWGFGGTLEEAKFKLALIEEIQSLRSQAGVSEAVAWRWRFEDQADKWVIQKHKPHWYNEAMTDIVIEPLYARHATIEITEAVERVVFAVKPYTTATLFRDELTDLVRAALQGETK